MNRMIQNGVKQKLQESVSEPIFFDESLSRFTTIRIGGPADALVHPTNLEELRNVRIIAHEAKVPVFIFGGGSNLLIRDGGIRGVVINLTRGFNSLEIHEERGDCVTLRGESGVLIARLMNLLIQESLTGLEFMAGIPASLGGAIAMNAGTRDGEIGDCIRTVTILDKKGNLKHLSREECHFSYRKTDIPHSSVIIEGLFELKRGESSDIQKKIEKHKARRAETQPLNYPNIGSIFKNPPKKYVGRLIEEAGLKNVRVGEARISEKHGNFIVNEGNASAKDVLALIGLIKDKVKEKFNITLETEVHVVGED